MSAVMTEAIIDAHHHIWRLADLPWLAGPPVPRIFGDYAALRRDYPIDEFVGTVRPQGVVKSVYVQVNVAPTAEIDEIAWVQSVADAHGFPHAIVGYADLAAPDLAATLNRAQAYANLRGVRQQLHWHETPRYRFASRPDLMNDTAWRAGLKQLEQRGLLFELQVFAPQMGDAAALAREFPGVTFVLLHAGMLEDRSPEGWARWQRGMTALAACPNVVTKLSGLGTFEHRCASALWRPVVEETIALFGAARCLFGSNFPIESLWTSYDDLIAVMRDCLSGCSAAERRAIFFDNAQRIYRLG
jgi:predicted TIM-barrel fold metal-dependent hydrolase